MFNITSKSCPYENWTSVARTNCDNPDHFHCLKDEYGRIGWVCAEPIWIQKDRCPVYNVVARKLDSVDCPQEKCPPYNYRSNEINVEYSCRYEINIRSSTTTAPNYTNTFVPPSGDNPFAWTIPIAVLAFIFLIMIGIILYIRYRKTPNMSPEEHQNLMEMESKPKTSLIQAKEYLKENTLVVITGVQGAGKTHLAQSIVNDMGKKGKKIIWISSLSQLQEEQTKGTRKVAMYIFDEIFYELQEEENVSKTFETLRNFLYCLENTSIIITIPSYIWKKHNEIFLEAGLDKVHIDLDDLPDTEKESILQILMQEKNVSYEKEEQLNQLCSTKGILFGKSAFRTVGFPAKISWICMTSNRERAENLLGNTLSKMSIEIEEMKASDQITEKANYLVLSYMSLQGGVLDIKNIDRELFDILKDKYCPEFDIRDIKEHVEKMAKNHYILKYEDRVYKFELHVLRKIVFVSVAEDNPQFVHDYNENDYIRHVITKENCPPEMEEIYTKCFLTIEKKCCLG